MIKDCSRWRRGDCPDNPKDCHRYENCGIAKTYPAGHKKEDYTEDE